MSELDSAKGRSEAEECEDWKKALFLEVLIDIRDRLEQLNTVIGNWANIEANRTK